MAKRVGSPYRPGRRSDDWRKIKLRRQATLLIAGYTSGRERAPSSARCCSPRTTSSTRATAAAASRTRTCASSGRARCRCARDTSPPAGRAASPAVSPLARHLGRAVARCEVEFTEWTRERRLRAPVFERLVRGGRREEPVETSERELKFTNQDKIFFPEEKITKGDLLAYYREAAHVLVPHLRDRRSRSSATPMASPASTSSRSSGRRTHPTGCARPRSQQLGRTRQDDRLPHGRRRRRAALDDQRGLHRRPRALCPRAELRLARLRALRPRPLARRQPGRPGRVALLVRTRSTCSACARSSRPRAPRGCTWPSRCGRGHTYPQARALVQLVAQALARATPISSRPSGTRAAGTAC